MSEWLWRNVIYGVFGAALLAVAVAWVRGALERIVPPPDLLWQRLARLARRAVPAAPGAADNRFALVFAPLDGDGPKAEHTQRLLAAFSGMQGFRRLRAETPIRIAGDDLDQAERAAEEAARALGRSLGADLVVWGAVHRGGQEIQLWLTPAHGAGSGTPLLIAGGAAAPAAAEAIAARLAALALAQLPEEEARQRFLDASLEHVLARVEALLARPPEALAPRDRAGLERARADALARLGADLGDPPRLRTALAAFQALAAEAAPAERADLARRIGEASLALAVLTADRTLLDTAEARFAAAAQELGPRGGAALAEVHDQLGRARYWRGAWDADPAMLDAAVEAFRDAEAAFAAAGLALRAADARVSQALIEAMRLARGGDPAGMEKAARLLREALAGGGEAQPRRQALAGMMLAWLEAALAQERGDTEALDAAARRAEAALALIPRTRAPLAWAQARAMQAGAEAARASYFGDAEALERARRGIDEARAALPAERGLAPLAVLRVERARVSVALAELRADAETAVAACAEAEAAAAAVPATARAERLDAGLLAARARALAAQVRGDCPGLEHAAAQAGAIAQDARGLGIVPLAIQAAMIAHAVAGSAAAMRSDRAGMAEAAAALARLAADVPRASRPVEHARVLAARAGLLLDRARLSATPEEAAAAWREAEAAVAAVLEATPADRLPLARAWFGMLAAEAAMRLAEPERRDAAAARLIEAARAVERFRQHAQATSALLLRAEAMLVRADLAQDRDAAAAAQDAFRAACDRMPRRLAPQRVRAAIGTVEAALRTLGPGKAAGPTAEAARALEALIAEAPDLPAPLAAVARLTAGTGLAAAGQLAPDRAALERGLALLRAAAAAAMPLPFRAEAAARLGGAMGAARAIAPELVDAGEIAATLREAAALAEAAGHPDKAAELRRMAAGPP